MHMTEEFLGGAPGNLAGDRELHQQRQQAARDARMLWVHLFNALALRAARWVALGMSFTLFAYATWQPEPWRLAAASVFTALCNLPLWLKKER